MVTNSGRKTMGWKTRMMWWCIHLAHLGAKYAEGNQDPERTAATVVVFPGTKVTPQLEELSMREGESKGKLFTEVLSSGGEDPILTSLQYCFSIFT